MIRNRYDALINEAEGFYMLDGENHEDMYRILKGIATTFRKHGATHIDDAWIKKEICECSNAFEPMDLKSLKGRDNYHQIVGNMP